MFGFCCKFLFYTMHSSSICTCRDAEEYYFKVWPCFKGVESHNCFENVFLCKTEYSRRVQQTLSCQRELLSEGNYIALWVGNFTRNVREIFTDLTKLLLFMLQLLLIFHFLFCNKVIYKIMFTNPSFKFKLSIFPQPSRFQGNISQDILTW